MAWIIGHFGTILDRIKVNRTTHLTAYESRRGKPSSAPMVPIAEPVLFEPLDGEHEDNSKMGNKFIDGIYLGINNRSGEAIVSR